MIYRVLKALEDGKLELPRAFLVVQEMISQWPQVVAHINSTSQRQEFQHLEGRVCEVLRFKRVWLFKC